MNAPVPSSSGRSSPWDALASSRHSWRPSAAGCWLAWSLAGPLVPGIKSLQPFWLEFCLPPLAILLGTMAFPRLKHRQSYLGAAALWTFALVTVRGVCGPMDGVEWISLLSFPLIVALACEDAVLATSLTGVMQVPVPGVLDVRAWRSRDMPSHVLAELRRLDGEVNGDGSSGPRVESPERQQARLKLGLNAEASPEQIRMAVEPLRQACQAKRDTSPRAAWVKERLALEALIEQVLAESDPAPLPGVTWTLSDAVSRAIASEDPVRRELAFRVYFHAQPEQLRGQLSRHREAIARAIAKDDVTALKVWNLSAPPRPSVQPGTSARGPEAKSSQAFTTATPASPSPAPTRLWPEKGGLHPVVAHATTRKYHGSGCPYGSKISSRNRVKFSSEREAITRGYFPCLVCFGKPRF